MAARDQGDGAAQQFRVVERGIVERPGQGAHGGSHRLRITDLGQRRFGTPQAEGREMLSGRGIDIERGLAEPRPGDQPALAAGEIGPRQQRAGHQLMDPPIVVMHGRRAGAHQRQAIHPDARIAAQFAGRQTRQDAVATAARAQRFAALEHQRDPPRGNAVEAVAGDRERFVHARHYPFPRSVLGGTPAQRRKAAEKVKASA